MLNLLIEATYARERAPLLLAANLSLEKTRYALRLSKDLEHLDFRRYEHAARMVDDIGRQVGGWTKQQREREDARPA